MSQHRQGLENQLHEADAAVRLWEEKIREAREYPAKLTAARERVLLLQRELAMLGCKEGDHDLGYLGEHGEKHVYQCKTCRMLVKFGHKVEQ